MTGSLAKLSAGNGYEYLTRQVACADATRPTSQALADYYSEKGEKPGVWLGAGLAGLEGVAGLPGLSVGDTVTEEQMSALFGEGLHPQAQEAITRHVSQMVEQGYASPDEIAAETKAAKQQVSLGQQFREYGRDTQTDFLIEVSRAYQRYNEHPEDRSRFGATAQDRGESSLEGLPEGKRPRTSPVPQTVRDQIRTEVGRSTFQKLYGRDPIDARELSAHITKESRPRRQAVSGYDVTFSPVKSVSALWAVADRPTAERIEAAHDKAVRGALDWAENNVFYTRRGTNGVASTDVHGVLAAAFTHRDSRAGDPDLHTHVAISAKVQDAGDGAWRALDGQVLYKAMVSISERYNSLLEEHLAADVGLSFAERDAGGRGENKRAIREVSGLPAPLLEAWSSRKAAIDARTAVLADEFLTAHGRTPTPKESIALRQQANLETREGKQEPKSLADQRRLWRQQAIQVLGSDKALDGVVAAALNPDERRNVTLSALQVNDLSRQVVTTLESARARFQPPHVIAEAERRVRGLNVDPAQARAAVDQVVSEVLEPRTSVRISAELDVVDPAAFRRADGASMYEKPLAALYTTERILAAEDRIVDAARRTDGATISTETVEAAIAAHNTLSPHPLNQAQREMVTQMATTDQRVQLALAPAGSGKTTSMRVLAAAWQDAGGQVIGLAPSAVAAAELRDSIDCPTDTLAKLVWHLNGRPGTPPEWMETVNSNTLLLIDEAGMAGTLDLDATIQYALARGASVRLIGDDQQLSSVASGGVLRDVAKEVGAMSLSELVRFKDPAEAAATLQLRNGDPEALGFYLDRGRVTAVPAANMTDAVYAAWREDTKRGSKALMLAYSNDVVNELNGRARQDRIGEGRVATDRSVVLASGLEASAGDIIVTRVNDRRIRLTRSDFVKNGDRWTVTKAHRNGKLTVKHDGLGRSLTLPADYVAKNVDLGYASTIHGSQGQTVDSSYVMIHGSESRQLLYVAMTRGRIMNRVFAPSGTDGDEHERIFEPSTMPATVVETLEGVITRDDGQVSARSERELQASPEFLLPRATEQYDDALGRAALMKVGPQVVAELTATAEKTLPGLTAEPAWDTLSGHLAMLHLLGSDAPTSLREAIASRELDTARDRAAVLDWRLDTSGAHAAGTGPLPWLGAVPTAIRDDEELSAATTGRFHAVRAHAAAMAEKIETTPVGDRPAWAGDLAEHPQLLRDVAIWRYATRVPDTDTTLLGPHPLSVGQRRHYEHLSNRIDHALGQSRETGTQWRATIAEHAPRVLNDPWWRTLGERLDVAGIAGAPVRQHLIAALSDGPLPDDHAAAALWSRMSVKLSPVVATEDVRGVRRLRPPWTDHLIQAMPATEGTAVLASAQWATLVATVNQVSAESGVAAPDLIDQAVRSLHLDDPDGHQQIPPHAMAAVLAWRVSDLVAEPPATVDELDSDALAPEDIHDPEQERFLTDWAAHHYDSPAGSTTDTAEQPQEHSTVPAEAVDTDWEPPSVEPVDESLVSPEDVDDALEVRSSDEGTSVEDAAAALAARTATADPSDPQQSAQHRLARSTGPIEEEGTTSRDRIVELNTAAAEFFAARYAGSAAAQHFEGRFGADLTDSPYLVGYAPSGFRETTIHLRRTCDATDSELVDAGLAHYAKNGRLIDDFRDRAMVGIRDVDGQVVGFIGRDLSMPDSERDALRAAGDWAPPKYSNTRGTAAFTKGSHVFGLYEAQQSGQGHQVRLAVGEGAPDAIALSLAGNGTIAGVSPMGTAMTATQADLIAAHSPTGTVWLANDNDDAGHTATARQHYLLTDRGLTTRDFGVPLPAKDPGEAWQAQPDQMRLRASAPEHHAPAAQSIAARIIDTHREDLLNPDTASRSTQQVQDLIAPYIAAAPIQDWNTITGWVDEYWPYDTHQARDDNSAWNRMTLYDRALRDAINWETAGRPLGGATRPEHPGPIEKDPARSEQRISDLAEAISDGKGFTVLGDDDMAEALRMLEAAADNLDAAAAAPARRADPKDPTSGTHPAQETHEPVDRDSREAARRRDEPRRDRDQDGPTLH